MLDMPSMLAMSGMLNMLVMSGSVRIKDQTPIRLNHDTLLSVRWTQRDHKDQLT